MTPPPRVVVIDHHDSYVWNLVHLVAAVTGAVPDVVLSPGPGRPDDPEDFAVGGKVLLAGTVPVLGVCLGMQGLVTTYGGVVERIEPAHGEVAAVCHDGTGLFAGIPSPYPAVRYHSLAATRVQAELVVTAECQTPRGDRW